jgi:hypothetical protein
MFLGECCKTDLFVLVVSGCGVDLQGLMVDVGYAQVPQPAARGIDKCGDGADEDNGAAHQ